MHSQLPSLKMLLQLITFLAFFGTSHTILVEKDGNITEIQVKTSSEIFADMTLGHIDVVVCGAQDCCIIERLNSNGINFQLGKQISRFGISGQ